MIEGLGWLRKAAEAGHPTAAYELARIDLGMGGDAEKQEAARWLRFASCSGYAPAMSLAAERGISVEMATCATRDTADFNGTWLGVLKAVKPADAKDLELRITIDRGAVRVSVKRDGDWSEVKQGKFTAAQKASSLMLSAMDTGWDLDGQWIESWTIELSRLSASEASGSFLRTVNNPNVPNGFGWKVFSSMFEGNFRRQ